MKKQRAFTLVELMITMAIVAILATAGIQAYTGYVKKGRDTARAQIAQNLNSSVMAYAASNGGKPPAGPDEFSTFLASAGETFGGGSIGGGGSGILLEDPAGGREVCLDAAGTPNQPCRFDYTAYDDGTYAISYGVEHKSSTDENFYKTTASVPEIDEDSTDINQQTAVEKYGVYIGSAKYIGQPAITAAENTAALGIDETMSGVTVAFRSLVMNEVVASGGGDENGGGKEGDGCFAHQDCGSGLYCQGPGGGPYESCYPGDCTYRVIYDMSIPQCAVGNHNLGIGSVCSSDYQCSSGYCIGGLCAQPQALNASCTSHTQCLYKMQHFCINSVCTYYNN